MCDRRWRYIRYADGGEELYDLRADPEEHRNLLFGGTPSTQHRQIADRLANWLPEQEQPLAAGSAHRILEKRADGFYWQEKKIDPADRVD